MGPGALKVNFGTRSAGSAAPSAVVFAPVVFEQQERGGLRDGGEGLDRLFAPFRDGLFVAQPDAQAEQPAGIGDGGGFAVGEQLVQDALVAGVAVAMVRSEERRVGKECRCWW